MTNESPSFSPASKLDELSSRQKHEVEQTSRPNAALIHETIRAEGTSELERASSALAFSGFAAGLSIGLSLLVEAKLHMALEGSTLQRLLSPLGYTTGFLVVVLGRQQLFTENTLTPILPLLHDPSVRMLGSVARLWAIVLATNIAGTWAFAAAIAGSGVFTSHDLGVFGEIAHKTIETGFSITLYRAIFAGWLIALMVWLLPSSDSARPTTIIVITYVIALGGFSHLIAGSVDCAFLVLTGSASVNDYILQFFVPTLVGNVIGGVALVTALNYGQVAREV